MYISQNSYNIGDDDAVGGDPDTCSFDGIDTSRTGQTKEENFMVRISVSNIGTNTESRGWQLYYNTADDPTTATQVTTTSPIVHRSRRQSSRLQIGAHVPFDNGPFRAGGLQHHQGNAMFLDQSSGTR